MSEWMDGVLYYCIFTGVKSVGVCCIACGERAGTYRMVGHKDTMQ